MGRLMDAYVDASFLDFLGSFYPIVGGGLILGLVVMLVGWLVGLVYGLCTGEVSARF